jgi:hypothetical protein
LGSVDRANELANFGITSSSMLAIETRILNAALERATSSDALAMVTAAELDKTFELLFAAGKSANKMAAMLERLGPARARELNAALRQFARRPLKRQIKEVLFSLSRELRSIASTWLGYRYGVMASIYDVQSWMEAGRSGPRRVRFTQSEASNFEANTPVSDQVWAVDAALGLYKTKVERKRRTMSKAGVLIGTDALSGADRYGLNRFASTAWELIPFSFVLDWLCDMGQRISAVEGNLLVKPLGTWITHDHNLLYTRSAYWDNKQVTNLSGYDYDTGGVDSYEVVESCRYIKRIANPSRLSAPLQVNVKLNWKRVADAISLVSVASSRLRSAAIAKM